MTALDLLQGAIGALLLFVVPGFAVARAVFPERRFRGPEGLRHALETATLSFVLSVAMAVVVGSALLGLAPGGFSAAWNDPVLEVALAGIAAVAFAAGGLRGAYSREAPSPLPPEPAGDEHAWELTQRLDRLHREDRTLRHRARTLSAGGPEAAEVARERAEISRRIEALEVARENEYAR